MFLTANRKQDHKRNGIVLTRNVGIERSFQSRKELSVIEYRPLIL